MNMRPILGLLGFVLLLGTAGASDVSNLPMTQVLVQGAVSLALLAIGCTGDRRGAKA